MANNLGANIEEGHSMVKGLLEKPQIRFSGGTMYEVPDESGIYVFSNRVEEALYIGQSRKGIRSRMKDHWAGTTSSDLAETLVKKGYYRDKSESRDWSKDNVVIRYMTSAELNMDIKWAEHFAIGALRPKLNG